MDNTIDKLDTQALKKNNTRILYIIQTTMNNAFALKFAHTSLFLEKCLLT